MKTIPRFLIAGILATMIIAGVATLSPVHKQDKAMSLKSVHTDNFTMIASTNHINRTWFIEKVEEVN